jgi:hypothetical protein
MLALGDPGAGVPCWRAEVLVVRREPDLGEIGADQVGHPVVRGVVDDDHFQQLGGIAALAEHDSQRVSQHLPAVERDEDHADQRQ